MLLHTRNSKVNCQLHLAILVNFGHQALQATKCPMMVKIGSVVIAANTRSKTNEFITSQFSSDAVLTTLVILCMALSSAGAGDVINVLRECYIVA